MARRPDHNLSKTPCDTIKLAAGLGVEGDAHYGKTVKHRSRVRKDPAQPNLRQVHLIHAELFDEMAALGFEVSPADMGENITTSGIDLLGLPAGTRLSIGADVIVEITGLRNPCNQINGIAPGLMSAMLGKDDEGNLIRKSGVMGIVVKGGIVSIDDHIGMTMPHKPHRNLRPV